MSTEHCRLAAVLALSALGGCASMPPKAGGVAAPQRTYVTGSRIAVPVDPRTGVPESASPLQIVSGDDLRSTGQVDLGSALRMLVPAIQ